MRTIHVQMPEEGVLRIWWGGEQSWVEIRGTYDKDPDDPFQRVIDAMPGWHSSVLWTGDVLAVLPKHPDYEMFARLLELEG